MDDEIKKDIPEKDKAIHNSFPKTPPSENQANQHTNENETPQEGEQWLNRENEEAFEKLTAFLDNLEETSGQEGIKTWFLETINGALPADTTQRLRLEDLQSLRYLQGESPSASEIAGREIVRPIFILKEADCRKFMSITSGQSNEGLGKYIKGEKAGLIIAIANKHTLGHEVRHSIDPHDRVGYDKVIDELFAFYHQTIVDETPQRFMDEDGTVNEDPWKNLEVAISGRGYAEQYSKNSPITLQYGQYRAMCREAVRIVKSYQEHHGHLETQRKLAQTNTLDDLFALEEKSAL